MKCKTCKWCDLEDERFDHLVPCRVNPPNQEMSEGTSEYIGEWPYVDSDKDWCGKYEIKEA